MNLDHAKDLYAPSAPGSLMRSMPINQPGLWRVSRRHCELYSVQIVSSGAWARARCLNGLGRTLWEQPSTFTGSFWLSAGAEDGLLLELHCTDPSSAPNITLNWREPLQDLH